MKNSYSLLAIGLFLGFHIAQIAYKHKDVVQEKIVIAPTKQQNVEAMILKLKDVKVPLYQRIAHAIVLYGDKYNIKYEHLVAIAFVESSFDPKATSGTGDLGLMQINWKWWGSYCKKKSDLFNIEKSVELACIVISKNRERGHHEIEYYHSHDKYLRTLYVQRLERCLERII